jgi:hypothetical protein
MVNKEELMEKYNRIVFRIGYINANVKLLKKQKFDAVAQAKIEDLTEEKKELEQRLDGVKNKIIAL